VPPKDSEIINLSLRKLRVPSFPPPLRLVWLEVISVRDWELRSEGLTISRLFSGIVIFSGIGEKSLENLQECPKLVLGGNDKTSPTVA